MKHYVYKCIATSKILSFAMDKLDNFQGNLYKPWTTTILICIYDFIPKHAGRAKYIL